MFPRGAVDYINIAMSYLLLCKECTDKLCTETVSSDYRTYENNPGCIECSRSEGI